MIVGLEFSGYIDAERQEEMKKIYTNLVVSVSSNCVLLLLSLIVPRLFLLKYGSDTNGLLSTLSQIFAYIALLEAGISQATLVQLYGPIKNGDKIGISEVLSVSRSYYRKITRLYALLVCVFALGLPYVINSDLDYWTIVFCVYFEGAAGVITFYFFSPQTILLNADGKGYINDIINLAGKLAAYAFKIILAISGQSIVLIQFGFFIISLGKMLFYYLYMKKHYPWVSYSVKAGNRSLPARGIYRSFSMRMQ